MEVDGGAETREVLHSGCFFGVRHLEGDNLRADTVRVVRDGYLHFVDRGGRYLLGRKVDVAESDIISTDGSRGGASISPNQLLGSGLEHFLDE